MINFNDISVHRLIMHTINAKESNQDHATAIYSNDLIEIHPEVVEIITSRLIEAAGKNSRAFELEILNAGVESFYDLCHDLRATDDAEFIQRSKVMASLLADTQTRTSIPGGYFIVIDALDNETNLPIYIVIKAEPHAALRYRNVGGHSQIELLQKVFLSPSQKLYKIGVLFKKILNEAEGLQVNDIYGAFLFDDQFRTESHPAEYFYSDFLGFSTSRNAKIQTQRFYDKTAGFIKDSDRPVDQKVEILAALKAELKENLQPLVTPIDFANNFIPNELRDKYIGEVVNELPPSIQKDLSLIKNNLLRRKINFPGSINLIGPDEEFDDAVTLVTSVEDLDELNAESGEYTIVKIMGKPYRDE